MNGPNGNSNGGKGGNGSGSGGGGGYIDPSGIVRTAAGAPVKGAKVTLLHRASGSKLGTVPNGSGIMSPANRRNPDRTDAIGHFGWDVLAGFYQVTATTRDAGRPTAGPPGHRC